MPNATKRRWVWHALGPIRNERLKALFSSDRAKDVFNEKFFDGVTSRLQILEHRELNLTALVLTLWSIMVLSLLPVHVTFSLFGISSDRLGALREILLILYSSLSLFSSLVRQEASYLKEMLKARAEVLTPFVGPGSFDARNVLYLTNRVRSYWTPNPTNVGLKPMWWPIIVNTLRNLLVLLFGLALIGGTLVLQWMIMLEIYKHPNFSSTMSVLVIGYAIAIDLIVLTGWYMRKGIYPYKDETPNGTASLYSWAAIRLLWIFVRAMWKSRTTSGASPVDENVAH